MKALSITLKDLQIMFKDRGNLFMLFLLPMLFIFIFSGALTDLGKSEKDTRIALAVVNQDGGEQAQTLITQIDAAGGVRTQLYSLEEAQPLLDEAKLNRILLIPGDFSAGIAEGRQVSLRLVNHPKANRQETNFVEQVVKGVAGDMSLESQILTSLQQMGEMQATAPQEYQVFSTERILAQARSQFAQAQMRPLVNIVQTIPTSEGEQEKAPDFSQVAVPGFTILFVFLTAQNTARSIHDEKKVGSFRRLMASPLSNYSLLAGKIIPTFIVGLVQIAVIFTFSTLGIKAMGLTPLSLGNSIAGLALVSVLVALCSSAFGVVIASFARTENQIGSLSTLLVWGMGLLGGCVAPLFVIEKILPGPLIKIVPHYWANRAMENLLIRQLGLADIALEAAVLLGFTLAFFLIGLWRFDFE